MTAIIRAMDTAYLLVAVFTGPIHHPDQLVPYATRDQCVSARKVAYVNEKNNTGPNKRQFRCELATKYYSTHNPVPRETPPPTSFPYLRSI